MSEQPVQTHCRVGKVRFKNGAEVTVLQRRSLSEAKTSLLKEVRDLVEDERPIVGYVVLAIRDLQSTSTGMMVPEGFPMRCMPAFVDETLRKIMWE